MDPKAHRGKLMLASFLTLVASGVGFATRAACSGVWGSEYGIDGVQFGSIMGAGFLGFGFVIFGGGILVEKFGYKPLLALAFILHLISAVLLFVPSYIFDSYSDSPEQATNAVYLVLVTSVTLFSVCQGLYEAVINPMVAQLYPDNKTHYLNILHAGWPAGIIIGGLIAAGFLGADPAIAALPWQAVLSCFGVIVLLYGLLSFPFPFPKAAGEASGNFSVVFSCFASIPFLLLIVLHGLVGYMELGVDSWMTKLMENLLPRAVLILVYTSALMFILRFFAGPIVHKINPIGLLFVSALIAIGGLLWLGSDIQSVAMIFVAATVYSLGKAFLWPTMLGVAGERYPQSGAVAMGALGAAGMLTVGFVAGPRIGAQQGSYMSEHLAKSPETFQRYTEKSLTDATKGAYKEKDKDGNIIEPTGDGLTRSWGFEFKGVLPERLEAATNAKLSEDGKLPEGVDEAAAFQSINTIASEFIQDADKKILLDNAMTDVPLVKEANLSGSRRTLTNTAVIPAAMAVGFLILLIYYRTQGGYKPVEMDDSHSGDGNGSSDSNSSDE